MFAITARYSAFRFPFVHAMARGAESATSGEPMKSIKTLISATALMLVAATGYAQRSHGPVGGSSNSGGMGYGMDGGMGDMSLVVAPDGTLITTSVAIDATTNTYKSSVVAVGPNGAIVWRWAAPNGVHRLELAGNIVLVSTGPMGYDTTTFNPELTALSLSNGSIAWKLSLPGIAMAIEPSATMIYALTIQPQPAQGSGSTGTGGMGGMGGGQHGPPTGGGTGTGMMNGARTLVAISNSGVILWKLDLN